MAKKLHTTPVGTAVYPRLEVADTKFVAEGVYSVKLEMTESDAAPLVKMLNDAMDSSLAAAKKENPTKRIKQADAPWKVDDETGNVSINFKLKASGKTKEGKEFTQKVAIFDAKGHPFLDSKVGGGSKLRVSFEVGEFWTALIGAGVTLRLRAVQVIDYIPYSARDAAGYGFESAEGFDLTPGDGLDMTKLVEETETGAAPSTSAVGGDDF